MVTKLKDTFDDIAMKSRQNLAQELDSAAGALYDFAMKSRQNPFAEQMAALTKNSPAKQMAELTKMVERTKNPLAERIVEDTKIAGQMAEHTRNIAMNGIKVQKELHDIKSLLEENARKDNVEMPIQELPTVRQGKSPYISRGKLERPTLWQNTTDLRLFISHLAIHKGMTNEVKQALEPYGISGFVAHNDIKPTKDWQEEIKRALSTMDAMLTIHTKGFSQSPWTQQEVGWACAQNVQILSLKIDEDPKGFIGNYQAILAGQKSNVDLAREIHSALNQ